MFVLLSIVFSLLRVTTSDYTFGIFIIHPVSNCIVAIINWLNHLNFQSLRHHSISVSLNSMTMCVMNVVGETNTTGTPVPPDDHEPFDYFHSYWNKNTAFYINNVLHGRFWNTMPAIPKYSWLCFFLHPMYPFLKYPLGTLLLG